MMHVFNALEKLHKSPMPLALQSYYDAKSNGAFPPRPVNPVFSQYPANPPRQPADNRAGGSIPVIVEGSNEQSSTPGAEYVDLSHLLRQNQNMPKVVHPAQEYSDLIPVFLSNTESQPVVNTSQNVPAILDDTSPQPSQPVQFQLIMDDDQSSIGLASATEEIDSSLAMLSQHLKSMCTAGERRRSSRVARS